jgi:hypothetical protein
MSAKARHAMRRRLELHLDLLRNEIRPNIERLVEELGTPTLPRLSKRSTAAANNDVLAEPTQNMLPESPYHADNLQANVQAQRSLLTPTNSTKKGIKRAAETAAAVARFRTHCRVVNRLLDSVRHNIAVQNGRLEERVDERWRVAQERSRQIASKRNGRSRYVESWGYDRDDLSDTASPTSSGWDTASDSSGWDNPDFSAASSWDSGTTNTSYDRDNRDDWGSGAQGMGTTGKCSRGSKLKNGFTPDELFWDDVLAECALMQLFGWAHHRDRRGRQTMRL